MDLSHLALAGTRFAVRVTPKASRNALEVRDGALRACVTCAPEGGKANAEVARLLARALGVGPTRLRLIKGQTARDKVFVLD